MKRGTPAAGAVALNGRTSKSSSGLIDDPPPDSGGRPSGSGELEPAAALVRFELATLDILPGILERFAWPAHLPEDARSDELLALYLDNALPEHLLDEFLAPPWSERDVQRLWELERETREWQESVAYAILARRVGHS